MQSKDYIREFVMILFIRKMMILAITIAAVAVAVAVVVAWPAVYRADGSVVIKGGRVIQDPTGVGETQTEIEDVSEKDLFSEMEILASRTVFRKAAEELESEGKLGLAGADDERLDSFTGKIQKNFSSSLVPRSNVVRTHLSWNDPEKAEQILKKVFDAYIAHRQSVYNPRAVEKFFQHQMETFQQNMSEREKELLERTGGMRVDEIEQQIKANVGLLHDLERSMTDLKQERIAQRTRVSFLDGLLEETAPSFFSAIEYRSLGDFAQQVHDIYAERMEVLQTYEEQTNVVRSVNQQVERLQKLLRQEANSIAQKEHSELESLNSQIGNLEDEIASVRDQNKHLNKLAMRAQQLEREISITEDTMRTFQQRYQEARIKNQRESEMFSVGIVQKPQASGSPVFPKASNLIPLGLVIGLLLGITVGFLIEAFDHSVKRPEELTAFGQLPPLFSVPEYA